MKMERRKSKSGTIALVVIISTVYVVHAALCPGEDNPFWVEDFEIPEERDDRHGYTLIREQEMYLAIELVPPEYVGCDINHNNELKQKIILSVEEKAYSKRRGRWSSQLVPEARSFRIKEDCASFYSDWFSAHRRAVLKNLHIIIKVMLLNLFEHNDYDEFRYALYGRQRITDLGRRSKLLRLVKIGMNWIESGSLPDLPDCNPELPNYQEFEQIHIGALLYEKLATDLTGFITLEDCYATSPVCREGPATTEEDCKRWLSDELSKCGGETHALLENAILFVRKNLGLSNRYFSLKFPMVRPCYEEGEN